MPDVAFLFSLQAVRRQLASLPCETYLLRLIHHGTRKPLSGERLWTAAQVLREPTIRFLRARNREGFDVYFRPYALDQNAGYILVDLDDAETTILTAMCANGHQPCSVVETSPGHLQAWIRVSVMPLPPTLATPIARHLARLYHADRASADWHHLGRLAGFTNQKPARRLPSGLAPWVKLRYAVAGLASSRHWLLETAALRWPPGSEMSRVRPTHSRTAPPSEAPMNRALESIEAVTIYQNCLHRLRIPQCFPQPDWSVADLWIAKELLRQGAPASRVKSVLRLGSPQFPRAHSDSEDYLRRTLVRAAYEITRCPFPARADSPSLA
jgi:hypothetical protein